MRGLLDEVEQYPPQRDRLIEAEQEVGGPGSPLLTEARGIEIGAARTMRSVRCACCQYPSMISAPVAFGAGENSSVRAGKSAPR